MDILVLPIFFVYFLHKVKELTRTHLQTEFHKTRFFNQFPVCLQM